MKANELMIGDWVASRKWIEKPFKLIALSERKGDFFYGRTSENSIVGPFFVENFEPIPITPEILKENGFINGEFYAESHIEDWQIMSDGSYLAARSERGWCIDIPCRYVHELQHALHLCGIDYEIKEVC